MPRRLLGARLIRRRTPSPRDGKLCRGCVLLRSRAMTWPRPSHGSVRSSRPKRAVTPPRPQVALEGRRARCSRSCVTKSIGSRARRFGMHYDMPGRKGSKWNCAMMSKSFDCGSAMMARASTPNSWRRMACGSLRAPWHARARPAHGRQAHRLDGAGIRYRDRVKHSCLTCLHCVSSFLAFLVHREVFGKGGEKKR